MHDHYWIEKLNRLRHEELLREAQHRRLIDQARAGRPRASGRFSLLARVRLALELTMASVQARL